MLEGATSIITYDRRVVLRSPKNKTRVILAKIGSYSPPKKDYSTLFVDAAKADDILP